jgi:hypothetical protein
VFVCVFTFFFFFFLVQVFWIIFGVIGAGVFYHEFAAMRVNQAVLLNLGFMLIAYGIYMLAHLHMKSHKSNLEKRNSVLSHRRSVIDEFARGITAHRGMPLLDSVWYDVSATFAREFLADQHKIFILHQKSQNPMILTIFWWGVFAQFRYTRKQMLRFKHVVGVIPLISDS